MSEAYRDVHFHTRDGLRLFARDYRSDSGAVPVLCLPGLTRSSKDFEPAMPQLSQSRRVIAMDFRGRGLSQWADDPLSYRVDAELDDAMELLDHLGIARAALVGTSRGGLVGTLMANRHPHRIAGLFLNDVGPVLGRAGLLRIRRYLGQEPDFASFAEAARALEAGNPGFQDMSHEDWMAFARRLFRDEGGAPKLDYDPSLGLTFPTTRQIRSGLVPQSWPLFHALALLPCALLRGANSDLLSRRTVAGMTLFLPGLRVTTVEKRGHAPFLDEAQSKDALAEWLGRVDRWWSAPPGAQA